MISVLRLPQKPSSNFFPFLALINDVYDFLLGLAYINIFCALNCGYALFKQLNALHFEKRNSICESTAGLVSFE